VLDSNQSWTRLFCLSWPSAMHILSCATWQHAKHAGSTIERSRLLSGCRYRSGAADATTPADAKNRTNEVWPTSMNKLDTSTLLVLCACHCVIDGIASTQLVD
jgi:hypothetical protein